MGAVVDDGLRALARRQAAQVGQALFGDDDLRVVLGVVHVRAHGHDAADLAVLGHRGCDEERQVAVAREVARAADAVHHARPHEVGGVDVAVDVGLDHRVHGDDAQAAHQLGVVADLLRAQDDAVAVEVDVFLEIFIGAARQRDGRGRGALHLAGAQQVQHAVLQHLGEAQQVVERAIQQPGQYGIGHVAHARLDGQHLLRQAAVLHFVRQEVDDVLGDALRVRVGLREHVVAVAAVRLHHGHHLARIHLQVGLADAVVGVGQADGHAPRRQGGAVVDVVHAFQAQGQLGVDLQDHLVGNLQPGLVVAHGGGGDQEPVGRDADDLDDGHIQAPEEAEPRVLRHVRQVHVDVIDLARIDLLARHGVGVERQALRHRVGRGQQAIDLGRRGGAGPHVDAVGPSGLVLALRVRRDGLGQRLGVARAGETAQAHGGAVRHVLRGLLGRHAAGKKVCVAHALSQGHGKHLQSR